MSDTKQPKRRPSAARGNRAKPGTKNPHIVEKQGLPVYTGPVRGDLTRAVEEDREERSRVLWGTEAHGSSGR